MPLDLNRRQKSIKRLLGPFPDPEDDAVRPIKYALKIEKFLTVKLEFI